MATATASIHTTDPIIQEKPYVGFSTITNQIQHKLLKRGFQFNIMVVGHSGLGKSTLINTLFASHLVDSNGRKSASEPITKTSEIKVTSHVLTEEQVTLNINCIDTPGFGDQVNNDRCWEPIIKYIKEQHSQYLRKELTAQREKFIKDTRVHAVLYFIQPTGHGLKALDIAVLKRLCENANVIPIIAKSDCLTREETIKFKETLKEEFKFHKFKLFPYDFDDSSEDEKKLNEEVRYLCPFAVIGSESEVIIDRQPARGRRTRWGTIKVEDVDQCDFVYLRDFLTRTHLQDLIETTALVHYESFRSKQLIALKEGTRTSNKSKSDDR